MDNPTETKKLISRGNVSINLFNRTCDKPGWKETMIRFEWAKRLPFASFSYDEFMNKSIELINLTKKYQISEPKIEILGFNTPQDSLISHSLSGGQDDEIFNQFLSERNSYSLENFTRGNYNQTIEPQLTLTSKGKENFMICLTALPKIKTRLRGMGIINTLFGEQFTSRAPYNVSFSGNSKGRLEFYGQSLNQKLYGEIVNKYHKPGLTHALSHPYTDDFKGWIKTLI